MIPGRSETAIGNETLTIKSKAVGTEEVTVAAGKYKALKVEVETTAAGTQVSTTYWFAPDVGVVKQAIDTGRQERHARAREI